MNNDKKNELNKNLAESEASKQETFEGVGAANAEQMALDDERRIKVLSPGALVFRRFIRNRLAIVGIIILVAMFLFSFLGGVLSPYSERQQFTKTRYIYKPFAGVTDNDSLRYTVREGADFGRVPQAAFIRAKNAEENSFESGEDRYLIERISDHSYMIYGDIQVASGLVTPVMANLKATNPDEELPEGFDAAVVQAIKDKQDGFELEGQSYNLSKGKGKEYIVGVSEVVAIASTQVLSFDSSEFTESIDFRVPLEIAVRDGKDSFEFADKTYQISVDERGSAEINLDGQPFAVLSDYIVQPVFASDFLSLEYKRQALEAVMNNETSFTVEEDGEEVDYKIERKNLNWDILKEQPSTVFDAYAAPSAEHPLGTDQNGMDLLTRLMYGGRISLMVGFVVVFISMLIGVIMGGISGYFGGWVDMVIMRLVDIFYCIPTYPILIILGSIMEAMDMGSTQRIMGLMLVLGFLSWAGTARLVRGQILQLREEEYMTAAEATGISTSRRITKHLIPNVMPLLIVSATMSLGGTILTESTLSFLGLGVKYPYASWGNIINAVSNQHVMTSYPFVWIPAGLCIVVTVVAFNFVGDGLRDAFDPKMKR
ncbi:MAG: ABC transporter permease [Eubacteriales bacterium]|nr:ABC transporter permease [Eubacteriales bacterium]